MLRERNKRLVKILLVESDEFNIRIADSFLYACGYSNVVIARNAEEALEQFKDNVGLILLSVILKNASGLEVCKKLRGMPRGKTVPILAFAPKGKGMRTKCFKVGMNEVMASPTSFQGFKSVIQSCLE